MILINKLLVFLQQRRRLKNAKLSAHVQKLGPIGNGTVGDDIE